MSKEEWRLKYIDEIKSRSNGKQIYMELEGLGELLKQYVMNI